MTCAVQKSAGFILDFDFVLGRRLAQNLGAKTFGFGKNRLNFNWKLEFEQARSKASRGLVRFALQRARLDQIFDRGVTLVP